MAKEEEKHEHTDACYSFGGFKCGEVEHEHDSRCYDRNGKVTCGMNQHTHTRSCAILVKICHYL